MKFLEEKFVPLAAKIGSQKHLACIRDSFMVVMPLTIAGAIGVLLLCIGGLFAESGLNMPAVEAGYSNFIASTGLSGVFSALNTGTINLMAIFISGLLSGKLAELNGADKESVFPVGIAAYMCGTALNADGAMDTGLFGASGLFVAMMMSLLVGTVYPIFSKNEKLQIKMPDGVPPAVAKTFSNLIPAIFTMLICAAIYAYIWKFTGQTVWDIINTILGKPLTGMAQSVLFIIVDYFMIDLLWMFGLHGANIMGSVTTPILSPLGIENMNLFANKQEPVHIFCGGFGSGYVVLGGSGATIGALVAIFLFSKSKATRTIGNLALAPGIFEINEPLTCGLPIVMNVVVAI
ncbi:MAG: PTS sugar transporter subunit IIC, partial [Erysipelotrichaceae bacterium]|nr:PTS sugar transporter subunit IIC [Erysipelotrichaceae bacterium]